MRFVDDMKDLPTTEQILDMSGLEFIQGIIDGDIPAPPIARTLNYRLESASEGRCVFRGTPQFASMNPIGSIHGGWFGTMMDSCMACAVQTTLPRGTLYTTLEYKVNIIRPILPDTGDYLAIGTVDHSGRRTAVASGQLIGAENRKIYATATTTCLIMKKT